MASSSDDGDDYNKIFMTTVSAPTNIACIKYWGKASIPYNTPTNDSVSVTLDQEDLRAVTTAAASKSFESDRLWLNGDEEPTDTKRFRACVDQIKAIADAMGESRTGPSTSFHVHVSSYNTFPTAAGLASSAAGYAALVAALAELFGVKDQYPGQLTSIARQGSGSACRSLYGGFVAWRKGEEAGHSSETIPIMATPREWSNSVAVQIADENHWSQLRALICVVSDAKKDTSSTAGMSTSLATSTLLQHRIAHVVPPRMGKIEKAFLDRDFATFAQLTMADSNQFHAVCLDTYPPIFYMNDTSKSIIRIIHAYNAWAGETRAAYTFDAGPNAVIYTLDEYAVEVGALLLHYFPATGEKYINNAGFLKEASGFLLDSSLLEATDKTGRTPQSNDVKMMYFTKSGPGPKVLPLEEATLDATSGLNTFKK